MRFTILGEKDGKSSLVHQKTRKAELEALADWIERSAADPAMRKLPKLAADKQAKPARPNEVIRHARKDRLLESFENTVWAMRFRCMSCHIEGTAENKKHVEKHGPQVAWFKAAGPEATLKYLMESKLIDPKEPGKSLLLRKPLKDGVEHGGGIKFVKGDQTLLDVGAHSHFLRASQQQTTVGHGNTVPRNCYRQESMRGQSDTEGLRECHCQL